MVNIKVDEGYAYDFLAILDLKKNKNLKNSKENFFICYLSLRDQIGEDLHNKIITSKEYKELLKANEDTFDAVEKARYGSISAKEVDDFNMKRYYSKVALQKKFFSSNIMEQKT